MVNWVRVRVYLWNWKSRFESTAIHPPFSSVVKYLNRRRVVVVVEIIGQYLHWLFMMMMMVISKLMGTSIESIRFDSVWEDEGFIRSYWVFVFNWYNSIFPQEEVNAIVSPIYCPCKCLTKFPIYLFSILQKVLQQMRRTYPQVKCCAAGEIK